MTIIDIERRSGDMSYMVRLTYYNGYRCICCKHTYEPSDQWFEDREKALSYAKPPDEGTEGGEFQMCEVLVIDGSTGAEIAFMKLDYVGPRNARYKYSCWRGHVDGGPFEQVEGPGTEGKTWAQVQVEIERSVDETHKKKLLAEIERRQRELHKLENKTYDDPQG